MEASACAVSSKDGLLYFSGDDSKNVYAFKTEESTTAATISVIGEASDDATGLAIYVGKSSDYLLVAQTDIVGVYSTKFKLLGSMKITGVEDAEIQGLLIYQGKTKKFSGGVLAFAIEHEEGKGFGISSLQSAFTKHVEVLIPTLSTLPWTQRRPIPNCLLLRHLGSLALSIKDSQHTVWHRNRDDQILLSDIIHSRHELRPAASLGRDLGQYRRIAIEGPGVDTTCCSRAIIAEEKRVGRVVHGRVV